VRDGKEVLRVVESSGNEGEKNADLLVRRGGYFEELGQDPDGLGAIGVLACVKLIHAKQISAHFSPALFEDIPKGAENALGSEIESFSSFSDGHEVRLILAIRSCYCDLLWGLGYSWQSIGGLIRSGRRSRILQLVRTTASSGRNRVLTSL